jgi:hypothetical protein
VSATEGDGPAAKRKAINMDVPDVDKTHCNVIYEAIKAVPDNQDLSDPSIFTMLPFPSLLPMPSQRFEAKKFDGVYHFAYMGRSKFGELQKLVKNENFLDANGSIYLYGTSGSGKSHILAALVIHLVRKGKHVFYIPDCSSLLLEPAQTICAALTFAFHDSAVLKTIGDPRNLNVDSLVRFMSRHRDLYIIVDQVNALKTADSTGNHRKEVLNAMRFQHRYLFSASANEDSNREADRKQSGILVSRIYGGMSKVTDTFPLFHTTRQY